MIPVFSSCCPGQTLLVAWIPFPQEIFFAQEVPSSFQPDGIDCGHSYYDETRDIALCHTNDLL